MGDEPRVCADCHARFVFSEEERVFYAARALAAPRRCGPCRRARRGRPAHARQPIPSEPRSGTRVRQQAASGSFAITCTSCRRPATVPFPPEPGRPVYCGPCHHDRRGAEKRATEGLLAAGDDEGIVE
jgi:CxxC-x17-CxxC domain-containing protein